MSKQVIRRAAMPALLGVAALVSLLGGGPAEARIQVDVNGQPVSFTDAQPMEVNNRVYIPLRDVAELLNADVRWNASSRTVEGSREGRSFSLPIGSRTGYVAGQPVRLDAPARLMSGRTMVPLRFAAEALGAEVDWHPAEQRVSVDLPGEGVAGTREEVNRVVVPAETVIQADLDERLSSASARVGDRFTATLNEEDRSRFPLGTRFEGRVTQAQPASKDRPGLIDVAFDRALLPDGARVRIDGALASLEEDSVRRTADGRLESRKRGKSKFDWKWVGIGAAGGAVLGTIFGDNDWLKGALLGGVGGAIYGYLQKDKGRKGDFHEVDLPRGTRFGVHLNQRVAFNR